MFGEGKGKRMREKIVNFVKSVPGKMPALDSKNISAGFCLLLVFAIGAAALWGVNKASKLERVSKEVSYLERLVLASNIKATVKRSEKIAETYVEDVLGKIDFLEKDARVLADLCEKVPEKDLFAGIAERHQALAEHANRLRFTKKEEGSSIIWSSAKSVEMSAKDLAHLLEQIEGERLALKEGLRPDLYICNLNIKRAHGPFSNLYAIDIQLIQKREL